MENKLIRKLLVKPGMTVWVENAPDAPEHIFGAFPADVRVTGTPDGFQGIFLFVKNSTELNAALAHIHPLLKKDTLFWIFYPKKDSGIETDLKMAKWDELAAYALTPCASAAVDKVWSGLRIKPIDAVKASGVGNDSIRQNEYGGYIDVANKQVSLPVDLAAALTTEAREFFNGLSYTNKKEYVLWVLTAKQEKTRQERIGKTLEKLLSGKKNPTEK
jgi:hypothetical protein